MDAYVEDKDTLFSQIFAHLEEVEKQPASYLLDDDLLKRGERSLDYSTPQDVLWRVLGTGERLLETLQQDPRPLTRLLERTVLLIPFDRLKTTVSPEKLEEGLVSSSIPVQLLCLAYLRRAADSPSGAAFVATSSSLVQRLVTVWLSCASTEVSERALEVLVALLDVDSPSSRTVIAAENRVGEARGQGLLWRRIFHDVEVYSLLFEWTSLIKSKHDLTSKKGSQAVTISQARLFDFVARVAQIDWTAITTSSLPSVECVYTNDAKVDQPYGGLLRYAASSMIDSNDFLMEILRRDFFVKLLGVVEESNNRDITPRLLEAIQHDAGVDPNSQSEAGVHL